jgi:uncharacterized Zn-finger protein
MMMPAMVQENTQHPLIQANVQNQYVVTMADLPLSCPMPGMYLWNSHPKVYLAIEATGWAKCSYCGAEYILNRGDGAAPRDASKD